MKIASSKPARIVLTDQELLRLFKGEIVTLSFPEHFSVPTVCPIEIALADIGFERMHAIVHVAELHSKGGRV
jgi:hypothetical protein